MTAPRAYPLSWPAHRKRTPNLIRRPGQFRKDGRLIIAGDASMRVEAELERLGGKYPLLSSNVELRLDGRPRADRGEPSDPGVCLYFELKGKPFALACDTYQTVAQNIAAIAAHLEATRAIERHGVASAAETLQVFSALPPPPAGGSIQMGTTVVAWHEVLGVAATAPAAVIEAAHRALARKAHPDVPGGSLAEMQRLNEARDAGLAARK